MPSFSKRSLANRNQLHPLLKKIVDVAIRRYDFTILDAQRGRAEQEKAFKGGFSNAHFGQSAHNWVPAIAMDLAPYPIDWDNLGAFKELFNVIGYYDAKQGDGFGIAKDLKIPLRAGLDWNRNGKWTDENWNDWGHYELDPWKQWAKEASLIED